MLSIVALLTYWVTSSTEFVDMKSRIHRVPTTEISGGVPPATAVVSLFCRSSHFTGTIWTCASLDWLVEGRFDAGAEVFRQAVVQGPEECDLGLLLRRASDQRDDDEESHSKTEHD